MVRLDALVFRVCPGLLVAVDEVEAGHLVDAFLDLLLDVDLEVDLVQHARDLGGRQGRVGLDQVEVGVVDLACLGPRRDRRRACSAIDGRIHVRHHGWLLLMMRLCIRLLVRIRRRTAVRQHGWRGARRWWWQAAHPRAVDGAVLLLLIEPKRRELRRHLLLLLGERGRNLLRRTGGRGVAAVNLGETLLEPADGPLGLSDLCFASAHDVGVARRRAHREEAIEDPALLLDARQHAVPSFPERPGVPCPPCRGCPCAAVTRTAIAVRLGPSSRKELHETVSLSSVVW